MSAENGSGDRNRDLGERVQELRTGAPADRLDRVLLLAGCVLVPLGVALILLGWLGASRTPLVFEQVPYVISGGVLGLALVFAGGFAYFGYWQTVRVREAREHQQELRAQHQELLAALRLRDAPAPAAGAFTSEALVATDKGSMVHRPDCPVVQDRASLRSVAADEPGLEPCGICKPSVVAT